MTRSFTSRPPHASFLRRRRGGAALEFAMLVPVWLTALAGIAEFSWLVYSQTTLDAAVNVGCRAGSLVDPGDGDQSLDLVYEVAQARTQAMMADMGDDCADCAFDISATGTYPDRVLSCNVSRPFTAMLGLVVSGRNLNATHVAHMEFQYEDPAI